MLRAAALAALASPAAAVCSEVRNKLKELHLDVRAEIARVLGAPPSNSTPQQRHLSLTGAPGELFVTWVVPDAGDACADSHATLQPGGAAFPAAASTYEAGVAGWSGHVYTARLTGLAAGAQYSYTATSCGASSAPARFVAPTVGPTADTLTAIMADMGTAIPLGFATAKQIEKDHAAAPFSLYVLAGDVAYATVDPPKDEFEEVWDAYGRMVDPFVSTAPFQIAGALRDPRPQQHTRHCTLSITLTLPLPPFPAE